jgi:hypothetical protein
MRMKTKLTQDFKNNKLKRRKNGSIMKIKNTIRIINNVAKEI